MVRLMKRSILLVAILLGSFFANISVAQDWVYTVQKNDTLNDICFDQVKLPLIQCVVLLKKKNNLKSSLIQPGIEISIPVDVLREAKLNVQLNSFFGEVYSREKAADTWKPISKNGQTFDIGSSLKTADGNAELLFLDGTRVHVNPNSEVDFLELSFANTGKSKTRLFLKKGGIYNIVEKQQNQKARPGYEVSTPAGVAAVRGTEFRVRLVNGSSGMFSEVLEGAVAVEANSQDDFVEKDFGIKAEQGAGLSPKQRLLEPPVISAAGSIDAMIKRIKWAALDKAEYYQYEIYRGNALLLQRSTQNLWAFLHFTAPGEYRFIVRGIDEKGFAGKDSVQEFIIQ